MVCSRAYGRLSKQWWRQAASAQPQPHSRIQAPLPTYLRS